MKSKIYNTILIINSPFQAICALEAVGFFQIDNPVFIILNDSASRKQVAQLVEEKGKVVYFDHDSKGTISLIKRTIGLGIKANRIFVGDYFSYTQYVITILCSLFHAKVFYMDDGNSTLDIFPPINRKRYETRNNHIGYVVFRLISYLFLIKESFFSIFDLPIKPNRLFKNGFFSLQKATAGIVSRGVFIIGTNSSIIKIKKSYTQLLSECIDYMKKKHPQEPVYYCPHRRDTNNYNEFLSDKGVVVFNTEISVEVDFFKKSISPVAVAGFGSTAILTLKMMFPSADCCSFSFESQNAIASKSYSYIENYYKQSGIEII